MHETVGKSRRDPVVLETAYIWVMDPTGGIWDYRADLEKLAHHLCRHPQDAEDVAHNALLKASEKLEGFRGEASVRTWLHTITTNECRMLRRRKSPLSLDHMFETAAIHETDVTGDTVDPEELAMELETRRELLRAIAELPDRHRCALILKDGHGVSLEETARLMGATVPAVKSILYRARASLREEIEKTMAGALL